jgi:hypothetical protein
MMVGHVKLVSARLVSMILEVKVIIPHHACQFNIYSFGIFPAHFSITPCCFEFVPIYVSSHFSIALYALKSLYISHLISPTCLLFSVKQLKLVEKVKERKVSYGAMVSCGVCSDFC